jgi:hypothetical protein
MRETNVWYECINVTWLLLIWTEQCMLYCYCALLCAVWGKVWTREKVKGEVSLHNGAEGAYFITSPPSYLQLSPLRCLLYECVGICVIGHAAMSAVRVRVGDLYRFFCVLYFLCKRCGNNVVLYISLCRAWWVEAKCIIAFALLHRLLRYW